MAVFVRMPQKGLTEESAILAKWYVKKGDTVKEGQYIFALETGKATFDVEAEVSGTVLELIGEEGDEVAVKAVVCVIGKPGESYTRDIPAGAAGPGVSTPEPASDVPGKAEPASPAAPVVPAMPDVPAASHADRASPDSRGIRISPRARRLAALHGIAPAGIAGSGPGGRIIEDDIKAALGGAVAGGRPGTVTVSESRKSPDGEYKIVLNGRIRRTIAANMMKSLQGTAQFTMAAFFDATEMLEYRERYNAANSREEGLGINDLVVYAVSRTILDFPFMNAHYSDEEMRLFTHVSIGIAVDTSGGLMVPVVKNAELKSLAAISSEIRGLAGKCREMKASPEDLSGGTFTVTNIGAFGVELFTPVINPPQTGILGVGCLDYRRKKTSAGMVDFQAMGLSLTVDHRAVDGAPAAAFLKALCTELENFPLLLVR